MSGKVGLVWDQPLVFCRFLEDCGLVATHVTPHLLASPFFRGQFSLLLIPTGFANPAYSCVLPALRASQGRVRRFVENGGTLLIYGGVDDRPGAYDWLPFPVTYQYAPGSGRVETPSSHPAGSIIRDYDPDHIEYDGYFPSYDGEAVIVAGGHTILFVKALGKGTVIVTSIHEYPSRDCIRQISMEAGETLF